MEMSFYFFPHERGNEMVYSKTKESPTPFECCVQKEYKNLQTKKGNKPPQLPWPLPVPPPYLHLSDSLFPWGWSFPSCSERAIQTTFFSHCKRTVISVLSMHLVFFIFINAFSKFKKIRYIVIIFLFIIKSPFMKEFYYSGNKIQSQLGKLKQATPATISGQMTITVLNDKSL